MKTATERVQRLRNHAMNASVPGIRSDEGDLHWYRGWLSGRGAPTNLQRRGQAKAHMLAQATPVIDEHELIVGKPCFRDLTAAEDDELKGYRCQVADALPRLEGQGSHMAIDYEKLLRLGVSGIHEQIRTYQKRLHLAEPADMEAQHFYEACLETLAGLLAYSDAYADLAAKQAAACQDEQRRGELEEIACLCRRVPRYPARTFREAVQSIHFVTFCLEGLYQLGRPDRYLYPFYERDRAAGLIDADTAQELIDCLCILYNEYVPSGLAVGLMVGGRDAVGTDVTNELSRLFVESIGHTRMIYPGVGLCYTSDTPPDLLERATELIGEGLSHPALFNDEVITRGLLDLGLPPSEACLYIHSTCVEITPIASSGVWVASPYINLVQLLLDVLENRGDSLLTMGELMEGYRAALQEKVRHEAVEQNRQQMERFYHGGDPLVSCFVNDCLRRGRDIDQGGARYNWIMPSFVGLANLVDSFAAVDALVFRERSLSVAELLEVLQRDFTGRERLRLQIQNKLPKYGSDEDAVDQLAVQVSDWVREAVEVNRTYRGDRFVPSFFCWIMHERLGRETGATPDARRAGEALGDGSGPAQGRERQGPTASILSSTKWDHAPFIGGVAVNMKFSRKFFRQDSLGRMQDLIRTYMARGGFEIQFNVVDKESLLAARQNPEQYRDLVVRVGGYSDFFVNLPPKMQEEVILRTEHEL